MREIGKTERAPRRATRRWRLAVMAIAGLAVVAAIYRIGVASRQDSLDDALIAALKAGRSAEAISLLSAGANANAFEQPPYKRDVRSLWLAALAKLQHRTLPLSRGRSALALACGRYTRDRQYGPHEGLAPANRDLLVALLRRRRPDSFDSVRDTTVLNEQAMAANPVAVDLLLRYGANRNPKDEMSEPLFNAVAYNSV